MCILFVCACNVGLCVCVRVCLQFCFMWAVDLCMSAIFFDVCVSVCVQLYLVSAIYNL